MIAKRIRTTRVMTLEEPGVPANKPFMHCRPMSQYYRVVTLFHVLRTCRDNPLPAHVSNIPVYHRQPLEVEPYHRFGGMGRLGSMRQSSLP